MFGLGLGEILVILVIALIFIGPKRLPEAGKKLGEFYRQFRDAADSIRDSVTKDLDETTEPTTELSRKEEPNHDAKPERHGSG